MNEQFSHWRLPAAEFLVICPQKDFPISRHFVRKIRDEAPKTAL
jgi:hypothetical protein